LNVQQSELAAQASPVSAHTTGCDGGKPQKPSEKQMSLQQSASTLQGSLSRLQPPVTPTSQRPLGVQLKVQQSASPAQAWPVSAHVCWLGAGMPQKPSE